MNKCGGFVLAKVLSEQSIDEQDLSFSFAHRPGRSASGGHSSRSAARERGSRRIGRAAAALG